MTLCNAGYGLRFVVVMENVSPADVYVLAEGNSKGYSTLSLEVEAGGKKTTVSRIGREWSKSILHLERLAPGGLHTRVVEYNTPTGKMAKWEAFPFGPKDFRLEVTLRGVFEQKKADWGGKLAPWAGRVVSPEYKVTRFNG